MKYTVQTQVEFTTEIEAGSPEEAKAKAANIPYSDQASEFLWATVLDEKGEQIEEDSDLPRHDPDRHHGREVSEVPDNKPFLLHYNFRCVEVIERGFDSLEEAKRVFLSGEMDYDYHPEYDFAVVYEIVDGKKNLVYEFSEEDVWPVEEDRDAN